MGELCLLTQSKGVQHFLAINTHQSIFPPQMLYNVIYCKVGNKVLLADIYVTKYSQCFLLNLSHLCISFQDFFAIWSHLACVCPNAQ